MIKSFRDLQGLNYDALIRVDPALDFMKSSILVTEYWTNQVAELTNLSDKHFLLYNGEMALIPYDQLNYTIYHQVDVVKPIFNDFGTIALEPIETYFIKAFTPNTTENVESALTFYSEIKASP